MNKLLRAPDLAIPTVSVPTLPIAGIAARFPVRRVYCVGRNYLDHIREMKEADERDPPFFFQKPADAVVEDGAVIAYPSDTSDFQFEVELVVMLGAGGRNLSESGAFGCIYGYAVGIDLTRRDLQQAARKKERPWEIGKSFDHSAPCGALQPAAKIGHPAKGRIWLSVNGTELSTAATGAAAEAGAPVPRIPTACSASRLASKAW